MRLLLSIKIIMLLPACVRAPAPVPASAAAEGRDRGEACTSDGECASETCNLGECDCRGAGRACGEGVMCCASLQCRWGRCQCAMGRDACQLDSDCCSGTCETGFAALGMPARRCR